VGGKWVELLKEIAPEITRITIMFNPTSTSIAGQFVRSIEAAGVKLDLETVEVLVHELAEIETVMTRIGREPGNGIIVPADTFTALHHRLIIELAARYRLPTIYPFGYFAAAGGLLSYGPDVTDQFRRSAAYVDRILRGEAPADLPVQQPTKFEFVINLKTAKELGLILSDKLLVGADELIE
jgi:putative ABC transport system substrate-binding protein